MVRLEHLGIVLHVQPPVKILNLHSHIFPKQVHGALRRQVDVCAFMRVKVEMVAVGLRRGPEILPGEVCCRIGGIMVYTQRIVGTGPALRVIGYHVLRCQVNIERMVCLGYGKTGVIAREVHQVPPP